MRKQRNLYISSTVISVLLHIVFFFMVAVSLRACTGPVSIATQSPPSEIIEAETITEQEINAYYEHKQQEALAKERALQLEEEQRKRAQRLAEEQKKAELLRQKKIQEEKEKQEEARLEQLRIEEQEKQRQAELRHKEEIEEQERIERLRLEEEQKRLEEEQKRLAEEEKRLAEEKKRQLEEEQKRLAEEEKRLAEEKQRQLEEEQKRLAEHRRKEEAERLKMRKKQIVIWQRQYKQMIRNSIEQHWKKPPTSIKGGECVLKIRQDEKGTILDVNFMRCEGDKLFIRSVEEAVWKSDPLPTPPSSDVFDSEIELTFKRDY